MFYIISLHNYTYWPRLFHQKYIKKKTLLNIYIIRIAIVKKWQSWNSRNSNQSYATMIDAIKRIVNLSTIYPEKYIKNLLSLGIVYRFLIDDNISRIILFRKIKSCNGGVKNRKWNTLHDTYNVSHVERTFRFTSCYKI